MTTTRSEDLLPLALSAARGVCLAVAQAACRYAEVSGEDPGLDMPESFAAALVLDRLGSGLTMTLETNLGKLRAWNDDARGRLVPDAAPREAAALKAGAGSSRVDLVLFHGDAADKYDQRMLALVELKRHRPSAEDRRKLLTILDEIDTCPFGVVCSLVAGRPDDPWLLEHERAARDAGDEWLIEPVPRLRLERPAAYAVCARLFGRAAARPRT